MKSRNLSDINIVIISLKLKGPCVYLAILSHEKEYVNLRDHAFFQQGEGLSNLDPSKATGPNGIPAHVLKECSEEIAPSLCALFNYSLRIGRFPSDWKSADTMPVHKKDLLEPAENYGPISLLPIVSKVMECCLCNRLYSHVSQSITSLQHGFMRSRSCSSQLLSVLHSTGETLDKNKQTDVLYLDFAKAFDTVDHATLIEKLKWYSVTGQLLDWFSDYLMDRSQRVVIDGEASVRLPVTSGVPQGSLVGPLLFVIFINDLPEAIHEHTSTALYADDTKLHRIILAAKDCDILQQDLTSLNTWSHKSNLKFNASKCKVLTVTRRKSPVIHEYHLGDVILQCIQEEKDLAVTISSNLSWDLHVTRIVLKANRMLGLLKRTCPLITDIKVRSTLYLSLVKSQISFATVVWSPASVKLRTILERVQRCTTHWILRTRIGEMSYKQRLLTLALLPLTYDRELRDLVFLYNCIFGYTDLNIGRYVTFITHG